MLRGRSEIVGRLHEVHERIQVFRFWKKWMNLNQIWYLSVYIKRHLIFYRTILTCDEPQMGMCALKNVLSLIKYLLAFDKIRTSLRSAIDVWNASS
jgi:hypothetical protein